ncbi:auxilin-like protein 1, partial [Tanacetum coccineum]
VSHLLCFGLKALSLCFVKGEVTLLGFIGQGLFCSVGWVQCSRGVSGSKSVVLVRIGNEDEVPCTTKPTDMISAVKEFHASSKEDLSKLKKDDKNGNIQWTKADGTSFEASRGDQTCTSECCRITKKMLILEGNIADDVPIEMFLAFEDRNDKLILHKESAEENYVPVDCDIVRLHIMEASMEMKMNFIRAITQVRLFGAQFTYDYLCFKQALATQFATEALPDETWLMLAIVYLFIMTVAVKKDYRKATLCIHPDKLQQRGASIQQKYICEKVFDLLKKNK